MPFLLAALSGVALVALMLVAARDLFRQTSERWTARDDLAVERLLESPRRLG